MIKPKMKFDGPIGAAEPGPVFIGIRKGQVGPSFGFKIWTKSSIPNQGPTLPKKPIWTRVIVPLLLILLKNLILILQLNKILNYIFTHIRFKLLNSHFRYLVPLLNLFLCRDMDN